MSIIDQLASRVGTRQEAPNEKVARLCVEHPEYLNEIQDNLKSKDKRVQGDCAEVFAEVAKIKPELTAKYIEDLLTMLATKNNRALWEGLAAISLVAPLTADRIYPHKDELLHLARTGSVIVVDGAVSTLGKVAAHADSYNTEIFPELLTLLETCIPRDIPRLGEFILPAVRDNGEFKSKMKRVLEKRLQECQNKTAERRVRKVIAQLE